MRRARHPRLARGRAVTKKIGMVARQLSRRRRKSDNDRSKANIEDKERVSHTLSGCSQTVIPLYILSHLDPC